MPFKAYTFTNPPAQFVLGSQNSWSIFSVDQLLVLLSGTQKALRDLTDPNCWIQLAVLGLLRLFILHTCIHFWVSLHRQVQTSTQ